MWWGVLSTGHIRLGDSNLIDDQNEKTATGRYAFQFTVPNAAGFQGLRVGSPANTPTHTECDWTKWAANSPPSKDLSAWMTWSFVETDASSPRPEYKLVRCGIGDGTSRITVNVINTEHGHEWTAFYIPGRQAWHDANNLVDYQLDCANWPVPTAALNYENAISEGASAWGTNVGVSFGKLTQTGCGLFDKSGKVTLELYDNASNSCGIPTLLTGFPLACVLAST